MTVTHGMDVARVESLGVLLRSSAERVGAICAELEAGVHGSTWAGPDADRFASAWWPSHRSRLLAAAEALHGFGQSALNNASEQRGTSGESSEANRGVHGPSAGIDPREVDRSPRNGPMPAAPGEGRDAPQFVGGEDWQRDWRPDARGFDQWNFAYDGDGDARFGNCTSFVAWRLNQLGHAGGHTDFSFTNNHLVADGRTVDFGRLGNAREWWGHAPAEFRSAEPTVGSVLVYERTDGMGDYGHVAVVREVRPDGAIVVEESAWDSYAYRQRTIPAGRYPAKFLDFLP